MKHLLILFLISCTTSSDVERRMGEGSSCTKVSGEPAFLCTSKTGKHYVCYADGGGNSPIFCFEAVDARDVE